MIRISISNSGRLILGRVVLTATLSASLAGCISSVGPDYEAPEIVTADQWHQQLVYGLDSGEANFQTWWDELNDPLLNSLISRASQDSLDIRLAAGRIAEARAFLGIASGERYPDVDGVGSAQRGRISSGIGLGSQEAPKNFTSVGVEASWEIDLWGRVRRSVESASANYAASVENYRDVLVVLYADIGSNYVQLRKLQQRLKFAISNVEAQRETLGIVEARYKAELAPALDLRQAELNLAITEAAIPALEAAIIQNINRLSILLGQQPGKLYEELLATGPIPPPPASLVVGMPADLARRRPDIRRAERNLAAQTAAIGVAEAGLYPNFFIGGDFGYAAVGGKLLESRNETWSIGPFFSWNLFDGGRIRNSIRIEEARTEQLLAIYEQTVLRSLQDVEDSLVAFAEERKREAALQRAEVAAVEAVRLVRELYKRGLTDFQNVLDSERSLFQQQDQLADSTGDVTLNLISIYRALGGGWSAEEQL
jgi:multidrug efflux system outer membrane protein